MRDAGASSCVDYYAGYAQDEFRVSSALTLNYGAPLRVRAGRAAKRDNHFTVGFDRGRPFPVQVPGLELKGGLMYAGRERISRRARARRSTVSRRAAASRGR